MFARARGSAVRLCAVTAGALAVCAVAFAGSAAAQPIDLATTPNPTIATVGNVTTLTDSAVLSGGTNPSGTITFTLFANGGTTPVDMESVSVNGDGTSTTPTGFVLPTIGSAGTYQWDAVYNGNSNNNSVSDLNDPSEQVVVSLATPGLSGTPNASAVTLGSGTTTLSDSAVLSDAVAPTGTITFSLSMIGVAGPVYTSPAVTVNGNGTYTTSYNVSNTQAAVGRYQWNVSYTGDTNNNSAASDPNDPNEQVVVNAADPAASVTSPANGAIYLVGQSVTSNFICSEGVGGPGITSCVDQSDQPSGQPVDTSTAGIHTFTVTATSGPRTGQSTVSYIVAGGPSASISSPAPGGVYAVGQAVATTFACTDAAEGPGISACTDSNGAGGGSGHLDTSTPGSYTYTVTALSGDGGTGSSSVRYTVAGGPSATITSPANGARYAFGQTVPAGFGCTDGPSGPGILTCAGNPPGGSDIDTTTPGTHTFTVTATSVDGQSSTESVTYTVLPSNHEVAKFKVLANGTFIVTANVPGPGRVDVLVTAWNDNLATTARLLNPAPHRFAYARAQGIANRAQTLKITVKPTARGRRLVASHAYRITLRVWISYTPRGGRQGNIGYSHVHLP